MLAEQVVCSYALPRVKQEAVLTWSSPRTWNGDSRAALAAKSCRVIPEQLMDEFPADFCDAVKGRRLCCPGAACRRALVSVLNDRFNRCNYNISWHTMFDVGSGCFYQTIFFSFSLRYF